MEEIDRLFEKEKNDIFMTSKKEALGVDATREEQDQAEIEFIAACKPIQDRYDADMAAAMEDIEGVSELRDDDEAYAEVVAKLESDHESNKSKIEENPRNVFESTMNKWTVEAGVVKSALTFADDAGADRFNSPPPPLV